MARLYDEPALRSTRICDHFDFRRQSARAHARRRGVRASTLIGLALATALSTTPAAGGDWPTFAGGPRRLFFNPAETQITAANVATLRLMWKFHTGAIVTASPSVAV